MILKILIDNKQTIYKVFNLITLQLHDMIRITKITIVLAVIFSLASCQSSKTGCYDFGDIAPNTLNKKSANTSNDIVFTNVICKP